MKRRIIHIVEEYDELEYSDDPKLKRCEACGSYEELHNFTENNVDCDRCIKFKEAFHPDFGDAVDVRKEIKTMFETRDYTELKSIFNKITGFNVD